MRYLEAASSLVRTSVLYSLPLFELGYLLASHTFYEEGFHRIWMLMRIVFSGSSATDQAAWQKGPFPPELLMQWKNHRVYYHC